MHRGVRRGERAKTAEKEKKRAAANVRFAQALKEKETVEKEIAGETVKRDEAGRIKRISPAERENAEQVNQAANDNKTSSVVIQQNDNRQNQSNEQKTVIEHNKELNFQGSANALNKASSANM